MPQNNKLVMDKATTCSKQTKLEVLRLQLAKETTYTGGIFHYGGLVIYAVNLARFVEAI